MITALGVAEARIKAVKLHDELDGVLAEQVWEAWRVTGEDMPPDTALAARAHLSEPYISALAAYREADFAAARLEAQRADEMARVDLEVVRDTTRRILEYRGSKAP